jgi:SAM-dependent methyltransferase
MDTGEVRERNRRSWNAAVAAHESHRPGQAAFLRGGGSTLFPEELELLGELRGRRLLHVLCNAGQDSLSLAALGAEVTGVDLSDEAVARARRLSDESGISARFVCADVDAFLAGVREPFDLIYGGYGVVCWLPDLAGFAGAAAGALAPGGRLALIDFHPASNMLDAEWRLARSYPAGGEALDLAEGVGDYVGASGGGLAPGGFAESTGAFRNPHPCRLYRWGIGEVVSALAAAGLRITTLREYAHVNGERPFARMEPAPGRRWLPPPDVPAVPLMYGLAAENPR